MFAHTLAIGALFAGAGLASAQSLSSTCQSALTGLIANKDSAACLNANALISVAIANSTGSVVDPIKQLESPGLCAAQPCSNDTLSSIVTNVTSGCSSDLSQLGLTTTDPSSLISAVQMGYPTVRQIACLKDTSSNTMCVTQELTNLQTVFGQLSITNIVSTLTSLVSSGSAPNVPANDTCNDCTKEALNLAKANFPSLFDSSVESTVQTQCGADFVNGETPSGIQQTAVSQSAKANGASAVLAPSAGLLGAAVSAVLLVGSVMSVLA